MTDASVFACRCRGEGLNGVTGSSRRLISKKPLRRFLPFTRGTNSLQRPVPVDPHREYWPGCSDSRYLVASPGTRM